jgi:hypothetical protein
VGQFQVIADAFARYNELNGDDTSFGSTEPAGKQPNPQPGKSKANGAGKNQPRLKSARAATYQIAAVKWLWPSRFRNRQAWDPRWPAG